MDKLKYVKLENPDGSYSESIPLAVDSDYVDVNGATLTSELNNKATKTEVNNNVSNLQNQINGLASGSPLVANSTSEMTDTTKIYVNITDGYWYYYDTNTWTQGGVYQATEINDDDPTIVKIKSNIDNLRTSYKNLLNDDYVVDKKIINDSGVEITDNSGAYYNQKIEVGKGESVVFSFDTLSTTPAGAKRRIYYFDVNEEIISRPEIVNNEIKIIPSNVKYVTIQKYINDYNCMLIKSINTNEYSNYYTANDQYIREIIDNNSEISDNLLNPDFRYDGYIINDNGEIVSDNTGCYFNQYINTNLEKEFRLKTNSSRPGATRRVYCYDENKNLLERPKIYLDTPFVVGNTTKYIMIQCHASDGNVILTKGKYSLPYVPYGKNIIDKKLREILQINDFPKHITKLYDVWEPSSATSDYESTSSYDNTNLEMTYQELLDEYYEPYLYQQYTDYKVEKRSLGQDSANSYYEMYYYIFEPKNYSNTVLISAGMNCCELSPIFGLAYFMEAIMNSTDQGIKILHDTTRFIILPIICPSSFEPTNKEYLNHNGVRINKNFNYLKSWDVVSCNGRGTKGAYPDSENETKALKNWINEYANSDLWIDCHADLESDNQRLFDTICSSQAVIDKISPVQTAMQNFYYDKGYFNDPSTLQNRNRVEQNTQYPKQLYSEKIVNIPSIMIEQFAKCTAYGATGTKQCESNSIKNYATMLSQYCLAILKK